eukprot:COSAG01_NODE_5070_length_4509_cov_11.031066_5_plen_37_part_00
MVSIHNMYDDDILVGGGGGGPIQIVWGAMGMHGSED